MLVSFKRNTYGLIEVVAHTTSDLLQISLAIDLISCPFALCVVRVDDEVLAPGTDGQRANMHLLETVRQLWDLRWFEAPYLTQSIFDGFPNLNRFIIH